MLAQLSPAQLSPVLAGPPGHVSHQATKFAEWRQRADDGYTVALWVVSTADGFSESCRTKAEEGGVLLIGGKDFAEMLLDAGLAGLEA